MNRWLEISNDFLELWNFNNALGCIDGKYISLQAPKHSGSEYYNYKGFHSIVRLAMFLFLITLNCLDKKEL